MVKKCLSGNIFSISLVLLISGCFLLAGIAEAAEKPAPKATAATAQSAQRKAAPKVQPQ